MTFFSKTISSRQLSLLIFLLSLLSTSLFSTSRYITDSYEYSIVASCYADSNFMGMNCWDVNYFFRPAFPSFLVLISSPFLDNYVGIVFWAWISSSLLLFLIWYGGKTIISAEFGGWAWLAFTASPFIRNLNSFADSRIIILPFILWAGITLLHPKNTPTLLLSGGIACILAFLTRMEGLLLLPIFLFFQIVLRKSSWKITAVLFTGTLGLWVLGIRQQGGILSISPRYWEGYLLLASQKMPLRWALDLFGMGIWSPPMRQIAIPQSPVSMPLDSINFQEWLHWLKLSVLDYFPSWGWGILGLGIASSFRKKETWIPFSVLSALMLPSLVITFLPQARDYLFPQANTFPIWLISLLGIIWALEQLSQFFPKFVKQGFIALGIALLSWFSNPVHLDSGIEFFPIAQQTTNWLKENTPQNSIVLSSYELAPIVFLSHRRWEQWPSPYDWELRLNTDKPVYALVSRIDPHAQNPLAFTAWKEPTAYFRDQENEFLVIQLKD